ncbi:hypothetical protein [Verrucosispora sioxanthis]|uniref:hypothetical protein n=1 Tax=Verrucosispora sioxanthis TaxID=2499994 RepID=UPI0020A16C61|nr:hypothetical protein [Verrucosispora sioxanthis]
MQGLLFVLGGVTAWPGSRYAALVAAIATAVAIGYARLSRLAVPWFAALLVGQPLLPLLAADRGRCAGAAVGRPGGWRTAAGRWADAAGGAHRVGCGVAGRTGRRGTPAPAQLAARSRVGALLVAGGGGLLAALAGLLLAGAVLAAALAATAFAVPVAWAASWPAVVAIDLVV